MSAGFGPQLGPHEETAEHVLAQLERGRSLVPNHVWPGIRNFILDGAGTGNFLTGLFENDLLKAACGADDECLARIADLAKFMHNYAPEACWGSREAVAEWRRAGGIRGGRARARGGVMVAEILPPETARPPMPGPLIVTQSGQGLLQQPDGSYALARIEQGLTLGWMDLGGGFALLSIRDAHCLAPGMATTISRAGLQGLIADLQSIDAQLGEIG